MAEYCIPNPAPRRARSYLLESLVLVLFGLALPLLWVRHAQTVQATDFSFDQLAAQPYAQAAARLASRGSLATTTFDGEPATAQATGLPPGQGIGMNPRFFNIGETPGALYLGESGTWYVLGRFRVLDYADGEWHTLGVVENQRYVYRPAAGGRP